jgi:hypothetical protein
MQAIDPVRVTRNKMFKKRFPQVGGVGGRSILGEETVKIGGKKGPVTKDLRLEVRTLEIVRLS